MNREDENIDWNNPVARDYARKGPFVFRKSTYHAAMERDAGL